MDNRILILGGYGNVGRPLARYLARRGGEMSIILGGRNAERGKEVADRIINETGFLDITSMKVDASNQESLEQSFQEVNMVVVASSTLKYAENVVAAAIKTGTDYLDTQLSSPAKLKTLENYEDQIINSGRIFITDGGFHPGLLAAIVRWADLKVGSLSEANIYGALKVDWGNLLVAKETVLEMVEEFKSFDMSILKEGIWTKIGYKESPKYDFGPPIGEEYCVPMLIEEMRMLSSRMPDLKDAGFYISGFNKLLDYVLFPIIMVLLAMKLDSWAAGLFKFGLRFSKPPFGVKLVAECVGVNGKVKLTFTDTDGYTLTVIPIVACLNQYLDGTISKPGLYWQAWVVEPERFFRDMKEMGLQIDVS